MTDDPLAPLSADELAAVKAALEGFELMAPDGWTPHIRSVESNNFEVYFSAYVAAPDREDFNAKTILAHLATVLNALPRLLAQAQREASAYQEGYETGYENGCEAGYERCAEDRDAKLEQAP